MAKMRDFLGPYRLVRLIRNGATSQIWEAVEDASGNRVAIKLLKDNFKDDKEEIASLKNEFEVASSMNSPLVLKAFHHGVENGIPHNVFELASETSFRNLVRMGVDAYGFMLQKMIQKSAEGLYYMHTKDWIHRDIKPDNFLVTREGDVKLIDYRIAEKKRTGLKAMFYKPKVQGTRSYMSPEQIRAKGIDERSDMYSYGCTLFELVTGKPPYTATSPTELLNKHLTGQVVSPLAGNPNVSPEFSELIKKMMAKKKESRPASMWEFLKELRAITLFKKSPRIPDVHPFDQLEKGEKGFNLD
ncbi:serine/threonine-protein kinase [Rosistilla oblonga]|uniref:serine/threonine-protein kinase n=1 Tax=Rosistilla oblonga TaxID=2527990 RepID=UPI003A9858A2